MYWFKCLTLESGGLMNINKIINNFYNNKGKVKKRKKVCVEVVAYGSNCPWDLRTCNYFSTGEKRKDPGTCHKKGKEI